MAPVSEAQCLPRRKAPTRTSPRPLGRAHVRPPAAAAGFTGASAQRDLTFPLSLAQNPDADLSEHLREKYLK